MMHIHRFLAALGLVIMVLTFTSCSSTGGSMVVYGSVYAGYGYYNPWYWRHHWYRPPYWSPPGYRPPGYRPPRPENPIGGSALDRPSPLPAVKPVTGLAGQPSTIPSTAPSTRPSTMPSTAPSTRPSTMPSTRPSTQPVTRPATRPAPPMRSLGPPRSMRMSPARRR